MTRSPRLTAPANRWPLALRVWGNPVARGNQLISIKVQLPTKLNGEERELLEQLAGHHSARGQKHPHKSGLFGGLFG